METTPATTPNELWALLELMGHGTQAGRISRPAEWGGLLRIDVPTADGNYETEFYGEKSIYKVKIVSEEIARAYAKPAEKIIAYDAPIVTREQHLSVVEKFERKQSFLERTITELERRVTAVDVAALPSPDNKLLQLATDLCAAFNDSAIHIGGEDVDIFKNAVSELANEIGYRDGIQ